MLYNRFSYQSGYAATLKKQSLKTLFEEEARKRQGMMSNFARVQALMPEHEKGRSDRK